MLDTQNIASYRGARVIDLTDDKIGKIDEIYLDDRTGQPEWALVNTGLFGAKSTFIPLRDATPSDDAVKVPFDKEKVKGAPMLDADAHLSPDEEAELYRYYGMDYESEDSTPTGGQDMGDMGMATGQADTGMTERAGAVGRDTSGPTTDDAMTRSEEQLSVGTRQQDVGRARLRKYVVTENVTQTVPVSREEVRIEREPITDANRGDAMDGPAISEEEHEVTLREEVPVVQKDAVPVERIRMDKETVTDQETVSEQVRKEQIEMEGGQGTTGTPGTPRP